MSERWLLSLDLGGSGGYAIWNAPAQALWGWGCFSTEESIYKAADLTQYKKEWILLNEGDRFGVPAAFRLGNALGRWEEALYVRGVDVVGTAELTTKQWRKVASERLAAPRPKGRAALKQWALDTVRSKFNKEVPTHDVAEAILLGYAGLHHQRLTPLLYPDGD